MINQFIQNDIVYHLTSRNMKALFTGKTEHLRHYDPHVVKLQMEQGFKLFEGKKSIHLPSPEILEMPLDTAMELRCSRRDYTDYKITLKELSTLLFYSAGYKRTERIGRKHVPSSGGFNTTEVFLVILNSDEIAPGLYYFSAMDGNLLCVREGDYRDWIRNDAMYQEEWGNASVVFFLASDFSRLYQKYYCRALRLCLLDAGHVAQNLYLACAAMDMKVCEVLGYVENEVEDAFELSGNIPTFSSLVIGR